VTWRRKTNDRRGAWRIRQGTTTSITTSDGELWPGKLPCQQRHIYAGPNEVDVTIIENDIDIERRLLGEESRKARQDVQAREGRRRVTAPELSSGANNHSEASAKPRPASTASRTTSPALTRRRPLRATAIYTLGWFHRSPQKPPLVPAVLQLVLSLPRPPPAWGMSSLNVPFQWRPAGGRFASRMAQSMAPCE